MIISQTLLNDYIEVNYIHHLTQFSFCCIHCVCVCVLRTLKIHCLSKFEIYNSMSSHSVLYIRSPTPITPLTESLYFLVNISPFPPTFNPRQPPFYSISVSLNFFFLGLHIRVRSYSFCICLSVSGLFTQCNVLQVHAYLLLLLVNNTSILCICHIFLIHHWTVIFFSVSWLLCIMQQ